ncbi:ImmA/IrrE family metallo-endopeptidase [Myxococcota bacterium]|nr:ImmA/IrrE family metallo-endopeptidase [Myxococcota bacterium]
MPIDKNELGKRLKTAREACNMTQEQVAVQMNLSRPTVAQIESGVRGVSGLELDALARLFGRDIREFVADDFNERSEVTAMFRAQLDQTGNPEVSENLRACIEIGREYANLERLLEIDQSTRTLPRYDFDPPQDKLDAIRQGERTAAQERARLGLGMAPLPELTVLADLLGCRTLDLPLAESVSGLFLNMDRQGIFIVLNRDHSSLRRRFSFVHEVGHVLMDRDKKANISSTAGPAGSDLVEVRANAFAATFLMPTEGLQAFLEGLGKGQAGRTTRHLYDEREVIKVETRTVAQHQEPTLLDVVLGTVHFGVSVPALLYRLSNVRLLSKARMNELKALDEAGESHRILSVLQLEDAVVPSIRSDFNARFLVLTLEAARRERISLGKLRELVSLVGVDPAELVDLLDRLDAPPGLSES